MINTVILPEIDTGYRCSICYTFARVFSAGESMCVEHAKMWNHGYGESIEKMKEKLTKKNQL